MIGHHKSANAYDDAEDAIRITLSLPPSTASSYTSDIQSWEDLCDECGWWEHIDSQASSSATDDGMGPEGQYIFLL